MISTVLLLPRRSITSYAQKRLKFARLQSYKLPITGYLVDAFVSTCSCFGAVYSHPGFVSGARIVTSDIQSAQREGGFWVVTTKNSRYVIVTFRRNEGKKSLLDFIKIQSKWIMNAPPRYQ